MVLPLLKYYGPVVQDSSGLSLVVPPAEGYDFNK